MFRLRALGTLSLLLAGLAAGLAAAAACSGARAAPGPDLAVGRGDLRQRALLTGELESGRAIELKVPQTRVFRLELRSVIKDGTAVAAGQAVAEFDNSQFTRDLEDKRLEVAGKRSDLLSQRAEDQSADAAKAFAVDQKRAALEKARLDEAVPRGILPEREDQERELALHRAEIELAKAEADRESHRRASAADAAIKQIEIAKGEREIAEAEAGVGMLTLRAPGAGIALLGEHPWEGRKLREGDDLYPGQTVVRLPDLSSLQVNAALSDVDDGRVQPGMPARVTLDAYPDRAYAGRVASVSPAARESARSSLLRSFQVKVDLLAVDTARMRPGMSAKVEVLGRERRGVLLAPRAALDLAAAPPRALLADGRWAPVTVGECDPLSCVVVSGLAAGVRLRPLAPVAAAAAAAAGAGG